MTYPSPDSALATFASASPERPALRSLTLRSAAAIAIAAVAGRFAVELPAGVAQQLADALIDLVTTLGLIGVAIGRTRARGPIV